MMHRGAGILTVTLFTRLVGSSVAKPKLKVADDEFPTGQLTPEGAASDLARAFITHDALRFRAVCIRPYGAGQARVEYSQYLDGTAELICSQPSASSFASGATTGSHSSFPVLVSR